MDTMTYSATQTSISKLPVELLVVIFLYLSSADRLYRLSGTGDPPRIRLGWVRVTHVCRYWREVAINRATLWTTFWPTNLNQKWIEIFLHRSADAPKSLWFDINSDSDKSLLSRCLAPGTPDTSRMKVRHSEIRRLKLYSLGYDISDIVEELGPDLSNLEDITFIQSKHSVRAPSLRHIASAVKLKTVKLDNFTLPWSSLGLFTGITELRVSLNTSNDAANRPSFDQLCAILGTMRQIEDLFLCNVFPVHPPSPSRIPLITLPECCLSAAFHEEFAFEGLLHLFTHLEFATATNVALNITDNSFDLQEHPPWESLFLAEVSRRAGPKARLRPKVIHVSSFYDSRQVSVGLGVSFEYEDDRSRQPPLVLQNLDTSPNSIVFEVGNDGRNLDRLWMLLLRMTTIVDASQTVALIIDDVPDGDEGFDSRALFESDPDATGPVLPLCQAATNARVLTIDNRRAIHAIFYFLAYGRSFQRRVDAQVPTVDSGDIEEPLVLPELETLVLIDSEGLSLSELIMDVEMPESCSIIECLETRKEEGYPITRMLVPRCHEHTEGWEEISSLVELLPY